MRKFHYKNTDLYLYMSFRLLRIPQGSDTRKILQYWCTEHWRRTRLTQHHRTHQRLENEKRETLIHGSNICLSLDISLYSIFYMYNNEDTYKNIWKHVRKGEVTAGRLKQIKNVYLCSFYHLHNILSYSDRRKILRYWCT